jgi:hypothetical protein
MQMSLRRSALPLAVVLLVAGCGVRTALRVGGDGSVPISRDGGIDAPMRDAGCVGPASCDDGDRCNGEESCSAGRCVPGMALFCDDGIDCTVESCDRATGCLSIPDDSLCPGGLCDPTGGCIVTACMIDEDCQDGLVCNGREVCAAGRCARSVDRPPCDDGIDCTVDSCIESPPGGPVACRNDPDDARCPIGRCDPALGCVDAPCDDDLGCDDGRVCNGPELCMGGVCTSGPMPFCDDGIGCTRDECSEAAGGCRSTPDSTMCPMGMLCDLAAGGCTVRRCAPGSTECDDGVACNGVERCNARGRCVAGPAPVCDDGMSCTLDRCIEELGCVSEPRAPRDVCGNGLDDDCDLRIDCDDGDCRGAPECPDCVPSSRFERACFDMRDDDCDGAPDCMDPDCAGPCMVGELCDNGLDDDGDGLIDCVDADCRFSADCFDAGPPPFDAGMRDAGRDSGARDSGPTTGEIGIAACTNGVDDDRDGRTDCRDTDCSPFGAGGECCNGIDDDGDGNADIFTCRCFDDATCVGVGDLDQVCWESSFSICAPRCNFYGADAFCGMFFPDLPRCNRTTGECER